MRRILFVRLLLAGIVCIASVPVPPASAMTAGTAAGMAKAHTATAAVERVVRVCRHRFFTSRRVCFIDRSRPPTVCHHIRSTSRRDCY